MTEHTSEPWTGYDAEGTYREFTVVVGPDEERIATLTPGPKAWANKRRIVACVNAFKGWKTDGIERATEGEDDFIILWHSSPDIREAWMKQKADLTEALRLLREWVRPVNWEDGSASAEGHLIEGKQHLLRDSEAFLARFPEVLQ